MKLIDGVYAQSHLEEIIGAIKRGDVFIYPTDTIYGLGCDATNKAAVDRVRALKRRSDTKPFSVIAPSKEWILDRCEMPPEKLDLLPGPYTLILRLKNHGIEAGDSSNVQNKEDDTVGVRIPDHWFAKVVSKVGVPFVTTSVNFADEPYMKSIEDVPKEILDGVDYVIYDGSIKNEPSIKVNLTW